MLGQCETGLLSLTGPPTVPSRVGISIADIAAATGSNEEAAKSRLRYAMTKLREAIGDE